MRSFGRIRVWDLINLVLRQCVVVSVAVVDVVKVVAVNGGVVALLRVPLFSAGQF